MVRLFVFDLDGTLVDSRRDIAESTNAVLGECGLMPLAEEAIGQMVGDGAATLIARAFEAAGAVTPADALDRFLRIYDGRLLEHTRAYEGVSELLDALAGRAALAVLTNKPIGATRTVLDGLNLSRFFGDHVLGGDGPLSRKPDPAGLLALIDRAGVAPSHAMMVGDSVIDFRTARRAGSRACVARYGFGFHSWSSEELRPADIVIDRPLNLLAVL